MPNRRHALALLAAPAVAQAIPTMAPANTDTEGVLRVVATEFPPYTTQESSDGGPAIAIARAALARTGQTMEMDFRPWSRLIAELQRGIWDGVIGVWRNPERESYLSFPQALGIANRIGFMARSERRIDVRDLSRLKSLRIGIVRGYANPPAFEQANLQCDEALDDLGNLRKLHAGRIDLALVDKGVAAYLLRRQLSEAAASLTWLEPSVADMPLYMAFNRAQATHAQRVAAFNKGMADMQSSGQLARLLMRNAELM